MLKLKETTSLDLAAATDMIADAVFTVPKHKVRTLIETALAKYALHELEKTEESIRKVFEMKT